MENIQSIICLKHQGNSKVRDFKKLLILIIFKGTTTNVSVALYIESMSSVRAQTMDFEVDCYLALGWYDRRLAHNCTHPILSLFWHIFLI